MTVCPTVNVNIKVDVTGDPPTCKYLTLKIPLKCTYWKINNPFYPDVKLSII